MKGKSLLLVFNIYLCCFQLACSQTALTLNTYNSKRSPSSLPPETSPDQLRAEFESFTSRVDLRKEFLSFKEMIFGSEKSTCPPPEENELEENIVDKEKDKKEGKAPENQFQRYLEGLGKDEEHISAYSWNVEQAKEEVKDCGVKRKEGLFDQEVRKLIKISKTLEGVYMLREYKELPPFDLRGKDTQLILKKAKDNLFYLQRILEEDQTDENDKVDLLVGYIQDVVLPMRDYLVMMGIKTRAKEKIDFNFDDYLPVIPTSLYEENPVVRGLIEFGPESKSNNFHIVIEKEMNEAFSKLSFRKESIISRDLQSLLKVPTKNNYVRAMKWMTLHMMIQQIHTYKSILGSKEPAKIPRSCQNQFNGDMPPELKFKVLDNAGKKIIHKYLFDNGLILRTVDKEYIKEGSRDDEYFDYYMEYMNRDPLLQGYSGLMPFDSLTAAVKGKDATVRTRMLPDVDNYAFFQKILKLKQEDISEVMGVKFKREESGDLKKRVHVISELIGKIIKTPEESETYTIEVEEGREITIDPKDQNLSVFLAETMQRRKVDHFSGLITGELRTELKGNYKKIPFPSLYGSPYWRNWIFQKMHTWSLHSLNDGISKVPSKTLLKSCKMFFSKKGPSLLSRIFKGEKKVQKGMDFCSDTSSARAILEKVNGFLKEMVVYDAFVPTRRLSEKISQKHYDFLKNLWGMLRDFTDEIPDAKMSQYDFLVNQMGAQNPWARTYLGYTIAKQELKDYLSGGRNIFGFSRNYEDVQIEKIIKRLHNFGRILKLNDMIKVNHGNIVLSLDEKKKLWLEEVNKFDPLLKQLDLEKSTNYFEKLRDISFETFLEKDKVLNYVEENQGITLRDSALKDIDKMLENPYAKKGEFYLRLYKEKGNVEKQIQMFDDYALSYGVDDEYEAKRRFLELDNAYKYHVMSSVILDSAEVRKNRVLEQLEEFCALEPDDHDSLRTLFYSTTKVQNEMNEIAGKPAIPKEDMDRIKGEIDAGSWEEFNDALIGGGSAVGMMGAGMMIASMSCGIATGGLCFLFIAGFAAASTAQLGVLHRVYKRKRVGDINERKVKDMEELYFANEGDSYQVSRWWFTVFIEALFVIPIMSVLGRSAGLTAYYGHSFFKVARKHGYKEASRRGKDTAQIVFAEAEANQSLRVLSHESQSIRKKMMNTMNGLKHKIRKIRWMYNQNKLPASVMSREIGRARELAESRVKKLAGEYKSSFNASKSFSSQEEVVDLGAKTVSRYIDPLTFHKIIKQYVKTGNKAKRIMAEVRAEKELGFLERPFSMHFIKKLRYENLDKNIKMIQSIDKRFAKVIKDGGNYEKFLRDNMDDLATMFTKVPVRLRELPYMFLLQGGIHVGGIMNGSRVKFLYSLADGIMLRKFFTSYSRLNWEYKLAKARKFLGLKENQVAIKTFDVMRSFQRSVEKVAGKKFQKQYLGFQTSMTRKIKKDYQGAISSYVRSNKKDLKSVKMRKSKKKGFTINEDEIRRILFHPQNEQEKLFSQALWTSVDMEKVLKIDKVGDFTHRAVQKLDYNRINEFQDHVNALTMHFFFKHIGKVELM